MPKFKVTATAEFHTEVKADNENDAIYEALQRFEDEEPNPENYFDWKVEEIKE